MHKIADVVTVNFSTSAISFQSNLMFFCVQLCINVIHGWYLDWQFARSNLEVQITNSAKMLQMWKFILLRNVHKETEQVETVWYLS